MSRRPERPFIADEALVERMIPAVQRAIVEATVYDDRAGDVADVDWLHRMSRTCS